MIKNVHIQNFKVFDSFQISLNDDLNIIVGNNEAGKSTILEAISLALTKRIGGKPIEYELGPYLFNSACSRSYLQALKNGKNPELPKILIELFLDPDAPELQSLRGSNNSEKADKDPLGPIWLCPADYREATVGTRFESPTVQRSREYKRQTERDRFIESNVKKWRLLEG